MMFKGYDMVLLAMKTLSCRDAGCDCDYIAKARSHCVDHFGPEISKNIRAQC